MRQNEEMIKINIWHGTGPLSQRERLLKGIQSFRTRSFRTQVWVSSYLSLSRLAPKFESGRTQASDRFSPDFYSSYLFETPLARAREQMLIVAYNKVVESSEY